MRLYILRHGQTEWNVLRRLQGQSDIPLNGNGISQARERAAFFVDRHLNVVYSSPLQRARLTAELVTEGLDIPIINDDRLKEMCFGVDEGHIPGDRTPGSELFFDDPGAYIPSPGAESIDELRARVTSFTEEILIPLSLEHPDYNVLISGHGALDKMFWLVLNGRENSELWTGNHIHNLSVAEFIIEGKKIRMVSDFTE